MPSVDHEQRHRLEQAARQAAKRSYCPYSEFAVGAALLTADGHISSGCNIENASYGLTLCAERVALACAVADGHRHFIALVLFTATQTPTPPCGACLQMLAEFAPHLHIIAVCETGQTLEGSLETFLPNPFNKPEPA
jgi:cytidine deaminase